MGLSPMVNLLFFIRTAVANTDSKFARPPTQLVKPSPHL